MQWIAIPHDTFYNSFRLNQHSEHHERDGATLLLHYQILYSVPGLCLSTPQNTYCTIYKSGIASHLPNNKNARHLFHFNFKLHRFGISTDQGVGTALTPLKLFRIWHKKWLFSSLIGATSRHFSSRRHLFQIKCGSTASCSSPCFPLWLFWQTNSKTVAHIFHHKISCWQDYSPKHNKAHVVVTIIANFASILRVSAGHCTARLSFFHSLTVIIRVTSTRLK